MPKRILEGEVVSDKTDKTITVKVERKFMHPIYKKYLKKTSKFAAHDPKNAHKVGERVQIIECRPISKSKRFVVLGEEQSVGAAAKAAVPKAEKAEKKAPAKKPTAKKTTAKKKDA